MNDRVCETVQQQLTDTHQCLQGPVTVTVAAGEESCLGSGVFGRSKAASHQKFFFLLNIGFARLWVCVVVFLRVRSCLPAVVLG